MVLLVGTSQIFQIFFKFIQFPFPVSGLDVCSYCISFWPLLTFVLSKHYRTKQLSVKVGIFRVLIGELIFNLTIILFGIYAGAKIMRYISSIRRRASLLVSPGILLYQLVSPRESVALGREQCHPTNRNRLYDTATHLNRSLYLYCPRLIAITAIKKHE